MKTLLIINPTSGQHRAEHHPETLSLALASIGADVRETRQHGDAEHIALEAVITGNYQSIVAAGGDGTVNEIVNGIMRAPSELQRPTIGIVPLGTSNILATELGIVSGDHVAAVDIIRSGKTRKIDIGSANARYFTMMASFGLDAEAVKRVQSNVKDLMGAPAYILSGMAALAQCRASKVEISIDDVQIKSEAFIVVVANTSSYGLEHVKVAPFAALDDGWLDICVFEKPPNDKIGFIGQILLLMARRHLGDPRVRYYRGKKVSITASPPMLGQIDGDVWRETPTVIDVANRALSFFVP
jgi:diacylglycerol kinase (ATP)